MLNRVSFKRLRRTHYLISGSVRFTKITKEVSKVMCATLIYKIFTGLARAVSATTAFKVFAARVSRTWFTVDSGVGRICSRTTSWGRSSTASTPSPRNATRSAWILIIINEYKRQVCKDKLIHMYRSLHHVEKFIL